ncbi:insulinoma-associated protein 2 [Periophthalmus magnuspinnatus]|uniref:insulinoma-associated protein 2 n=1 Tax=Periophthalmus magnuspinnatus TaxID=409849 RepID=UPI00145BD843|nr:insulinoma-associated protein 2 [Periophthalmus magnuspinnatus]
MPRGFLVKRNRRSPGSYRTRKLNTALTPDCHEKAEQGERAEEPCLVLHEDGARAWSPHVEPALEAEVEKRAQLPEAEERVTDAVTPDHDSTRFFPPLPSREASCVPITPASKRVLEQQEEDAGNSPLFRGRCVTPELPFLLSSTPASVPFSRPHTSLYGHESSMHAHLFPSLSMLNEGQHGARKRSFVETDRRPSKVSLTKKPKINRKLHFEDEVTTSPVLGLRIKKEVPDSRAQRERSLKQPLGEFICQLCKEEYRDPFSLAQHKCSRIVRVEYRCPECDKVFSCPANLASHRRWHKPRPVNNNQGPEVQTKSQSRGVLPLEMDGKENELLRIDRHIDHGTPEGSHVGSMGPPPTIPPHYRTHADPQQVRAADSPPSSLPLPFVQSLQEEELYECRCCGKKFRRQAYLKKHLAAHEPSLTTYSQARDSQVFLCHICGARFPSAEIRDKHRLWHTVRDELIAGTLAGVSGGDIFHGHRDTESSSGESEPQDSSHLFSKQCPSTFFSSSGLTRHINKTHTAEDRHVMLLQMSVRP